MKKTRGVMLLLLAVIFSVFMLAACRKEDQTDNIATTGTEEVKPTDTPKEEIATATPIPTKAEEVKENDMITQEEQSPATPQEIRDIPSTELVKEIKIGWNLGNTMDATGGNGVKSETSWGNPITTKEMIDAVKAAGFNTIRIPTTWEKHLGSEPEYTIDKDWLDRVQQIVDYARANDMFVIINMHHEEWHFPSYDNLEKAKAILTKAWKQIADRFENYDEHLIFEGMNEPRMKGTNLEWTGGDKEARDVINQLDAAFVETVRNAGGNNPLRHLMIPPYAASSDPNVWKDFILPEDNKIIVSLHAYTPYNFTLNKNGTPNWSVENANDTRDIDNLMNNIYNNFISKGIPAILGEFGAMNKDNLDNRIAWAEYYITKATEKGIPCIWWDNGAFVGGGENFGLLDRRNKTWKYPEVVDALMKGLQ
jgi:endoglucanase